MSKNVKGNKTISKKVQGSETKENKVSGSGGVRTHTRWPAPHGLTVFNAGGLKRKPIRHPRKCNIYGMPAVY